MKNIACVGEVMVELSPLDFDTARIGVAGDTYNTAVYLRRALSKQVCDVSYVTALGDEAMSERIMDALQAEDLSTDLIERRKDKSPGLYMISRDERGERSFTYWRSAAAARTLFDAPYDISLDMLNRFDLVYFSGISLAILPQATRSAIYDWADAYRAQGGTLAFDSNYRPRLWEDQSTARAQTMEMWRRCDVALPSMDDEMALFDESDEKAVISRLQDAGVIYGALKRGELGPRALDEQGGVLSVQPVADVVDTTAAGDSFNAGFLAAWVQDASMTECMSSGHNLSAEVIRHPGAILPKDRF